MELQSSKNSDKSIGNFINNTEDTTSGHRYDKRKTSEIDLSSKPKEQAKAVGLPNGGHRAWLQVVGAFVLFFNTWGLMNTFGVYQSYYESGDLFESTSSNISWIGSIQAFLMLLVGAITGPIFDAGHLRFLLCVGTFGIVFGHMMLSLCHEFWQALLAQGFAIGLGAGFLFIPSFGVISQYFDTWLVTAVGLSVVGSSLGGIIYPIMFNKLLHELGFQWAVRIIGFMALGMLVIPLFTMQLRTKPPERRAIFDKTAFTEPSVFAFMFSGFFGYIGLLIPFFYIPFTARAKEYASENLSFYLLPMLNAASIIGRVVPSIAADKIGPLNMLIPTAALNAVVSYSVIAVDNTAGMIAIAVFYGLTSGTYISLPAAIFVQLTPPDRRHLIGTRMGMGFTIMGLGALIGTPVAGAIAGSNNYITGVYLWSGTTLVVACVGFFVVRYIRVGSKLMVKI
ncbi:hypothetical protein AAFC00_001973 [Neodothiora populina]|uniref:Major facilitator superfamily (MFS) profile domain-containing protein n=1 Tax=Neodothiora populina TaxID=2781224 RepID=A0ABR3PR48_9PEZI